MSDLVKKNQRKNFSLYPLFWAAAFFASGIFFAEIVSLKPLFWLLLLMIAIVPTAVWLRQEKYVAATVFVLLAFFFAGAFSQESFKQKNAAANSLQKIYETGEITSETPLDVTGVLRNEPEAAIGGAFLNIAVEKIEFKTVVKQTSGGVRVFVPVQSPAAAKDYENLQLRYGARVQILTVVSREERFRNPGMFEFRRFLASKNLDATASLKSPRQIRRLDDATVFAPLAWLYDWRQNLIVRLRQYFSVSTAGVLAASLLNNRYFLARDVAESFRAGGTFHILVISGLHITFIGVLVAWTMKRLTKNVLTQFVVANVLLWAYTLMVGAEAPVTRAAIMFTIFHGAVLFYRRATPLNSLGAAALVLLAWQPGSLFDQSFQLTFISVAAIVACAVPLWEKMRAIGEWQPSQNNPAPPVCARWFKTLCETLFWSERRWQKSQTQTLWKCRLFKSGLAKNLEKYNLQIVWRFVFGSILVSAIVQIWLAPAAAVYFHRFTLSALVLNMFVGALMVVESLAAVVVLLVGAFNTTLAEPLVWFCELLNRLMIASAEPFAHLPWATFRIAVYADWRAAIYVFYFAPLALSAIALYRWNPFQIENSKFKIQNLVLLAVQCLLLVIVVFHPWSAPAPNGRLRVDFLDVGQGDATLITTPDGTTVLVDGGGRPSFGSLRIQNANGEIETFEPDARSIGEAVVCEYLWATGRSKIDFLIATHADADHIQGLNDVVKNFPIENALVGRAPMKDAEFIEFYENLRKRKIPLAQISRGEHLEIGGATFEVLHPAFESRADAPSTNNDSVVLRVSYGNRVFLLTGDVEKETERILLQKPEALMADVVKVAHHGSRTSSIESFTRATQTKFAVITVGKDSPFGHPHKEVVERWRNAGAEILTTGERGTISFLTDGENLEIQTFVQN